MWLSVAHACHRTLSVRECRLTDTPCVCILLNVGVPDVRTILQIQTCRAKFLDNLSLNELLNLSRNCEDDVTSIRVIHTRKQRKSSRYQSLHPVRNAEIAARVSRPSSRCCDLTVNRRHIQVIRARCHNRLFSLFQRACSLACGVLQFPFTSFVLSSTGAGLILWIRPTFCA